MNASKPNYFSLFGLSGSGTYVGAIAFDLSGSGINPLSSAFTVTISGAGTNGATQEPDIMALGVLSVNPIPEPSSLLVWSLLGLTAGLTRWRRRRAA